MYEGTKLADFTPRTEPVQALEITDLEVGTGEEVRPGAAVKAHYTGALVKMVLFFKAATIWAARLRLDLIRLFRARPKVSLV